jgi:pimeloyl-ACP methyl ester carboxylesterase
MKRQGQWIACLMIFAAPGCSNETDLTGSDPSGGETLASHTRCASPPPEQTLPLAVACEQLAGTLQFPNTVFTSATSVPAGALTYAGQSIPAHCQLTGSMYDRLGSDGNPYGIGFEMRLPLEWNRRYFYQGNGGLDGAVIPALGFCSGGGSSTVALLQGFAVISSDAGHADPQMSGTFGIDPQARLDYGYQAIGKLTPMAKSAIRDAYGVGPRYSYIGGCSNGGRHAMVAAARYADQYDGYLVGAPGFNLPTAAVASIYGGQQYASLAPGAFDLSLGFSVAEKQLLSRQVLVRCDALDGLVDGMVYATEACQRAFDVARDVPTCPGDRDGSCLTSAQKTVVANIWAGPKYSDGRPIYSTFPFDAGHGTNDAAFWEYISPLFLDSLSVGYTFQTPPADPLSFVPPLFALMSNIEQLALATYATNATYTESSMSFMTPPDPSHLAALRQAGKRMIIYHGVSDPIFSSDDTIRWYESLDRRAQSSVRLYLLPGMGHCGGGPSTDQFDLLTPLVRWVEEGDAPEDLVAGARGPVNPAGPNADLPAAWSPSRTRPLCAYPRVAEYRHGDVESAQSFHCRRP